MRDRHAACQRSVRACAGPLPWLIQAAAAVILALHIGGGVVGIVSGFAALALRKGGRWHRLAGNVFFVAMLAMSGIGATVAPFLPDWGSAIAGLFTFYLVVTGWMAVRRKPGQIGRFEIAAIGLPVIAVIAELTFCAPQLATHNPKGTFEGCCPPFPMYLIASVATLAVVADPATVIRHWQQPARGPAHRAPPLAALRRPAHRHRLGARPAQDRAGHGPHTAATRAHPGDPGGDDLLAAPRRLQQPVQTDPAPRRATRRGGGSGARQRLTGLTHCRAQTPSPIGALPRRVSGRSADLVAHLTGGQGVAGSDPVRSDHFRDL